MDREPEGSIENLSFGTSITSAVQHQEPIRNQGHQCYFYFIFFLFLIHLDYIINRKEKRNSLRFSRVNFYLIFFILLLM